MGLFDRLRALLESLSPVNPWPAIDVTLPDNRHLHLVGSIHMGTKDMSPLSARLIEKVRRADALIVEADIRGGGSPFGFDEPQPPLRERLDAERVEQIEKIASELAIPLSRLDSQPAWQVALMLQAHQAQSLGLRPEYGIDYQLLQAAQENHTPVLELEGADNQIALLRQLPGEGLGLLQDTLTHWHTNARLLQLMIGWWLGNPPREGNITLPNTFAHELYNVLMHQRNLAWCEFLLALPPGRYVVAVGALHLYGEGNVPALLKNR